MATQHVMSYGTNRRRWADLRKRLDEVPEPQRAELDDWENVLADDDHIAHLRKHRADHAALARRALQTRMDLLVARKRISANAWDQSARLARIEQDIEELSAHIKEHESALAEKQRCTDSPKIYWKEWR